MAKRHNKYCTFKRTEVCICENIAMALAAQQEIHDGELLSVRMIGHKAAAEIAIDDLVSEQLRELAELEKQGSYMYTPTGTVWTVAGKTAKPPIPQRKRKQRESMKNLAIMFGGSLLLLLASIPILVK